MRCICTARIDILSNGETMGFFSPTRGIKQGDPLSPYIFILCMEFSSIFIEKEVREGKRKPLRIGKFRPH